MEHHCKGALPDSPSSEDDVSPREQVEPKVRSLKRLSDEERDQWPQRRLFASFSATVDPPPPPSPRYGATTAGAKSRPSSPQQYQQESGNRAQGLVPSPLSFSYSSKGDKAEDIDTLIEALGSGNPSYLDIGSAKSVLEAQIIRANFDGWCHKCTSAITGWRHYICKDDRIGRWIHAVCALRGKKQRMDLQIQSPFARAALPMPQRINSPGMPAVGSGEGETDEQPVAVDEGDEESGQEEGGEEQPGMREEANKAKEQPRTGDEGEEVDNRQKVERKGEVEFGKEDRAEEAAAPHHCGWMVATRAEEDGGERMGGLRDLPAYTAEQAAAAEFEVCRGDFVVVRAFAGTGKTTTARGIIRHRLSTAPSSKILYVVFSKAAKEDLERKEAELVHAGLLSVKTCHALAKARIMRGRGGEGMEFVDADVPKVDELVQRFNLEAYANPKPGRHQERRRKAVARKLGGFIRRTLNCFLRSASRDISKHHVSTRYLTERLSDVSDDFTLEKLIFLTKMAWEALQKGHGGITHDGYTKQCQLHNKFGFGGHPPVVCPGCGPNEPRARLLESRWGPYCALCEHNVLTSNPPFDMIIVDEAQDLSPCQFDMLAPGVLHDSPHPEADGHPLNPTIYFIGDSCQQIYGWRGATGDAFLPPFQPKTAASFTLTEAFRFGPEVAAVASSLLRFKGVDGAVLKGKGPSARVFRTARAPQNSPIVRLLEGGGSQATEMDLRQLVNRFRGHGALTVLCRTNKGMSGMLLSSALRLGADMPSWFIKGGGGAAKSLSPKSVLPYVRLYYGEGSLRLPGAMEAFTNWEDLRLWAEAGETNSVLLMMELVEEWERIGKGKLLAGLEAAACRRAEAEGGAEVVFVSAHGAKGLEFPVVLLADDFRCPYCRSEEGKWELLTPELLQTPYYREESNLLYVAVTRAQKVLICNANLSMFLDAEEGWPPSPAGPSESVLDELRAEHELAWRAWLLSEEQVQAGDLKSAPEIPYPTGPRKGNLLHIHRNMDFKTYLRRAVLRWHPDKWPVFRIQQSTGTEDPAETGRVVAEVEDITKNINRLAVEFEPAHQ